MATRRAKSSVISTVTEHAVDKPMKAEKWEERVWYNTTAGRFTRMKRKERFIQSVKSVVDALTQQGYVTMPEDLLTFLYDTGMITKREFKRLVSIKPSKPLKVKPIKFR